MAVRNTITQRITLEGGREIQVQFTGIGKSGEQAFRIVRGAAESTADAGNKLSNSFKDARTRIDQIRGSAASLGSTLRTVTGLVLGGLGVRALVDASSRWSDYTGQVQRAVGATEEAGDVMERLRLVANRSFSSLDTTVQAFLRLNPVLKQLKVSTNDQLDVLETLNNALVVSGAKGQAADVIMNNLARAFTLGGLRGEQFNAVAEQGGRVLELLAKHFNVPITALRELARQGKITTDVLLDVFGGSNLALVRKEADAMAVTINDAFLIIQNNLLAYIGNKDEMTGTSKAIANGLKIVANNLDTIIPAILGFAFAWSLVKLGGILAPLVQIGAIILTTLIPALGGASIAISPVALAATTVAAALIGAAAAALYFTGNLDPFLAAITGAVGKFFDMADASKEASDAQATLAAASTSAASSVAAAGQEAGRSIDAIGQDAGSTAAGVEGEFDTAASSVVGDFADIQAEGVGSMKAIAAAAKEAATAVAGVTAGGLADGGPIGLAGGGQVRGRGTSVSDSILAWLSNGEYVIRAAAVKRYGVGLLNAINGLRAPGSKAKGFALGGLAEVGRGFSSVPSIPAFADGGGVSGRPFNLNIGGEMFENLIAPEDVADKLVRFAITSDVRRTGRLPSWYGGGRR